MSDAIGTVRREDHDGGYSIWVKVGVLCHDDSLDAAWQCVFSTAIGNIGETLKDEFAEQPKNTVIALLPGTPASEPIGVVLDRAVASVQELKTAEPGEFNRGWNAAIAASSVVVRREGGAR